MCRAFLFGTALLVLAGCGGDEAPQSSSDDGPATPSGAVDVVAEDIGFSDDSYAAPAGEVDVSYRNAGNIAHSLVIEDVQDFRLEVNANGDEDRAAVELDAGTYTLFCDIPGHREGGMEAVLEVT
jgi:plastocyanin